MLNGSQVVKAYPRRGSLEQFRLSKASEFVCFRCHQKKTAKLVATCGSWQQLMCNGCYGYLLSVYEVKAGTESDDVKAEQLAGLLLKLLPTEWPDRVGEEVAPYGGFDRSKLSSAANRFVMTAEHVASSLTGTPGLDWSAAIVGLCKAVELEFVSKIIDKLKPLTTGADLTEDIRDKDIGRIAKYIAGTGPPPELGSIGHFLNTAANSKSRAASSPLLMGIKSYSGQAPQGGWILEDSSGAIWALQQLTKNFRNPACHIAELGEADYAACKVMVCGDRGILAKIALVGGQT